MKIACLTFHNSSNYGAVLQTYALQESVTSLGHNYYIINYSNSEKRKFDSIFGKNKESCMLIYLYKLISSPFNAYIKRKFIMFTDKYLNVTSLYRSHEELKTLNGNYDYFNCGSDQVWNAEMIRYDSAYFLSFVSNEEQRLSYAASFGKSIITEDEKAFYNKMLLNINRISVREISGKDIVKQCSGKDAQVVLDPTLLLNKDQWSKIAVVRKSTAPYILVYALRHDPIVQAFLRKLKRQTGFRIIYISRGLGSMLRDGATSIPSPEEWVGLFMNASYVVTTSFHGTAFSANFNRPFFSFIEGDKNTDTNSRIVHFLKLIGLSDRLYTACPVDQIDLTVPDFDQVNEILSAKRRESLQYLMDSLDKF